ncbi:hypothetical protein COT97_00955 [Candidatus Falkowbacteria bacterium CG10_big_fil_rev_8_21_14_0_10_39_11]|uniref:Uncharacterized protein n=1 Tax=Candidatus Falkowbacteria bacterium CG10_big_fil_rev_8_21_14_0_10_39_11 TaxID=1974565 RepID=A0A2H0V601_9BACT|nr:MAG: hypothetical protein COT97_00955 [Candidatus Falkowbacteria bacterium CG10_big_fil_rev_8_21_14_0_10_39_11]
MTANILEQFNIKKDFKFKNADHQRQYSELLRKAEISAADRTFEELNDDINFLILITTLLDQTRAWIDEEIQLEKQKYSWDYQTLEDWAVEQLDVSDLSPRSWFKTFFRLSPDGVVVCSASNLNQLNNDLLEQLPPKLQVNHLLLQECKNFKQFSHYVDASNFVKIQDCPSLVSLNCDFHANHALVIDSCLELTEISGLYKVVGDFWCTNCSKLKKIIGKLIVDGDFHLDGSTVLIELPSNTYVRRDVYVRRCQSELIDQVRLLKEKGLIGGDVYET